MKVKAYTSSADRMLARLKHVAEAKMQSAPVQAAKYLHKSVRHSIRISTRPAKPGRPVHTRKRAVLKNAISSRVLKVSQGSQVEVGLSAAMGSKASLVNIAGLHEHGGSVPRSMPNLKVGSLVPIRKDPSAGKPPARFHEIGSGYVFARAKTPQQVQRGISLMRQAMPSGNANYPARPYLAPALAKAMKAPGFLRIFSIK
jgi:hypothetical protein